MRLVRGRGPDPDADRTATDAMLDRAAETGIPALRVWRPHRQVAFGRRDASAEGFGDARDAAERREYRSVVRSVGGRAVAYTGRTLAFAHAVPLDDPRRGLTDRYEGTVETVLAALGRVGVPARRGEPPRSFCPGDHSVQCPAAPIGDGAAEGPPGKVAGVAQRVRSDAALVGGCVVVADHDGIAEVLAAVYDALGVPFDPGSVGSVALAGGPAAPDVVARALEAAFLDVDTEAGVEDVGAKVQAAATSVEDVATLLDRGTADRNT